MDSAPSRYPCGSVVGLPFTAHGAQKLFSASEGMESTGPPGPSSRSGCARRGLRADRAAPGKGHAWAAGGTEFLGGLAIALGLVTPIPAAALVAVMTAAVITVHLKNGFFNTEQRFEYNLALAAGRTREPGGPRTCSSRASAAAGPP
jgi:putative oxidoreductase